MSNPGCSDRRVEERPPPPSGRGRPCFPAYYLLLLLPLLLSQPPITDRLYPVDDLDEHRERLLERKAELLVRAARVGDLERELAGWRSRTDTLFEIRESRRPWSVLLRDLAGFVGNTPGAWVNEIRLSRRRGGGALFFRLRLLGSNLREIARFRDTVKIAPNFAYHFGQLEGYGTGIHRGIDGRELIHATCVLPLKSLDRR